MSCYGGYGTCNVLPQPARVWSRVQNACTYGGGDSSDSALFREANMLEKGNVLQYKTNSMNLTTWQRYAKIAKGEWVNRNTTWASQSVTSSNPNTTWLKRTGNVTHLAIDPITGQILGPTALPLTSTCPTPINTVNEGLPDSVDPSVNPDENTNLPNNVAPSEDSVSFPSLTPVEPVLPLVIADGGTLVCSIQENTCTGETKHALSQTLCHPASDSDVPGQSELCWDDGRQTWYPRQRYVMNNSTDKWPINYKGLTSAIRPTPPILNSATQPNPGSLAVTLVWTQPPSCLPVSYFKVYQDGVFILETRFSTVTFAAPTCGTFVYQVTSVTNGSHIESDLSNALTVVIAATTDPNVNVLWSVTDLDSPWMYLHVHWTTVTFVCGSSSSSSSDLFRLTVETPDGDVLYTEDVPYDPSAADYDVYVPNIDVSEHGKAVVTFLSSSLSSLSSSLSSLSSLSPSSRGVALYRTVSLPLFTYHYMDDNRSVLTCKLVTVAPLYQTAQLVFGNGANQLSNARFYTSGSSSSGSSSSSSGYVVEQTVLPNTVLEYTIVMSADVLQSGSFPYLFSMSVANTSGIQEQIM